MIQAGLLQRQEKLWLSEKPTCLAASTVFQVELGQAAPVLLLLLVGTFLSTMLLIMEILWERYME